MATLCHICETVGPYNAIGKVAMESVRIAVDAGYKVTVVAKRLHESLRNRVEWLELYAPPRGFALQWLSGRHFIKKALGDRKFDIVHGHQPQIPDLCDVFQCHFLTRVAYERGCMDSRKSIRGRLVRAQEQIVLYAEDYCYRRWPAHTRMLYDSELTRQDFHRLYAACPNEGVLVYPCKPANFASDEQRRAARQALVGDEKRIVIGYLGGLHERKGYKRLIDALAKDDRFFLLMGGQYSETFVCPELAGRYKALGLVDNIEQFYAACDVFAIPSYYEPFGLVAFEAAGRGTPVLATPEVGALPHLIEHNAGSRWDPATPIGPLVLEMVSRREQFAQGAAGMLEEYSAQRYGERLLDEYSRVLSKAGQRDPARAGRQSLIGAGA